MNSWSMGSMSLVAWRISLCVYLLTDATAKTSGEYTR